MIDSVSGAVNAVLAMQQQKTAEQINTAVLVKAQNVQKQEGANILQLINSSTANSSGIDVHV